MHTKCDTDIIVNVCERDNEYCVCSSELPATAPVDEHCFCIQGYEENANDQGQCIGIINSLIINYNSNSHVPDPLVKFYLIKEKDCVLCLLLHTCSTYTLY